MKYLQGAVCRTKKHDVLTKGSMQDKVVSMTKNMKYLQGAICRTNSEGIVDCSGIFNTARTLSQLE